MGKLGYIGTFLLGAAVGTLGTGVVLKKYYEKQIKEEIIPDIKEDFEERLDALRSEMEEKYGKRTVKRPKNGSKEVKKDQNEPKNEKNSVNNEKKSTIKAGKGAGKARENKVNTEETSYDSYYKQTSKKVKEQAKKIDDEDDGLPWSHDGYSKIIHTEEYMDLSVRKDWETFTLSYYTEDKAFVDANDGLDTFVVNIISPELIDMWDEYYDGECLYIKNINEHKAYEIVIYEDSFAEKMSKYE